MRSPLFLLLSLVLCLLFSLGAFGQHVIKSADILYADSLYALTETSQMYVDPQGNLSLEEVRKLPFQPFNARLVKSANTQQAVWLKLRIHILLNVGYQWMLHTGKASLIDVYSRQADGAFTHTKTGFYRKNSEKEEIRGKENSIPLLLLPQENELYIRYQNQLHIGIAPRVLLQPVDQWQNFIIERNLYEGIAQGVLAVLFLYNILLFIILRKKTYFYYSLYIFGLSYFYLNIYNLGRELFFGEIPRLFDYNWATIQLIVVFLLLFMSNFLDTRGKFPAIHTNIRWLTGINIGFVAWGIVYLYMTRNLAVIHMVHRYFNFVQFVYILGIFGVLWISGIRIARLFILGTVPILLGGLWDIAFRNASDVVNVHINYFQVGAIFQLILFSLSIGYKMKEQERKRYKAQNDLISQLKENEKLKDKINQELEEKVHERTSRLQTTNDELQQTNRKLQETLHIASKQKTEIEIQTALLQSQNTELSQLNQEKNRLFSIIAHDLNAPLHALQGLLYVFENKLVTEEELKRFIPEINKGVHYTANLFNNLLSWAKSQMEGSVMQSKEVDIQTIIEENIQLFSHQRHAKKITIENKVHNPLHVYADEEMLKLVVRNLLSNALKFTPENGIITIQATIHTDYVEVAIQDTGQGISIENQQKLFQNTLFTSRGTRDEKGSGLGLILCRDFVEKHAGKIWVKSTEGKGSTFYFTMPLSVNALVSVP